MHVRGSHKGQLK